MISIMDYLQDTIFEQAFQRKTLKNKISNLQEQPIINLIKIAIFGMESTWKTEFITVIKHIELIKRRKHYMIPIGTPLGAISSSVLLSGLLNLLKGGNII